MILALIIAFIATLFLFVLFRAVIFAGELHRVKQEPVALMQSLTTLLHVSTSVKNLFVFRTFQIRPRAQDAMMTQSSCKLKALAYLLAQAEVGW